MPESLPVSSVGASTRPVWVWGLKPPLGGGPSLALGAVLILAGALSGWTLLLGDAVTRTNWPYFSAWDHWSGALGLYAAAGALLGLVIFLLIGVERRVLERCREARRTLARGLFYGVVGGLASVSTAIWTFSGAKASKSPLAVVGPILFACCAGIAAGAGALTVQKGVRFIERMRLGWLAIALLFLLLGVLAAFVDLTVYVALYSRIHTILELVSALCFGAGYALVLLRASRLRPLAWGVGAMGGVASLWLAACVALPSVRAFFDESLKHVWLEEGYVARMLRRLQVAEAFFDDPLEWRGMRMARLTTLKKRYALGDLSLDAKWNAPLAEPKATWDALRQLRGGQKRYNVLIYYIDTLRADVAGDASTMPGLAKFRSTALDFQRAYSTGSDTLRSLPALTGGNYDVFRTPPNDLLRVAKHADYDTVIVSAKSAFEFLGKLRPEFYFDRSLIVEDYPAELQVWGYGADRPTAPDIVTRTLSYLDQPRTQPFFLWLFNFDQHNWRELDAKYIDENAARYGIKDDPSLLPFRYRVVARAIDHEFSRLVAGLEQRGLLDETIILFVSDHGEALGRDGFWVHSVFLWESLIRVPLVLKVPGLPPRKVTNKVSLVDVAPTLGRFLDPTLDGRGFHGEDLLGQTLPVPQPRRFPLLLLGASKDQLVRVGAVDPVEDFKLVLSFEAALPELYDLSISDPDAANFASQHRARTKNTLLELVRSPVFPREPDDFDVRDTKEQKGLLSTEAGVP